MKRQTVKVTETAYLYQKKSWIASQSILLLKKYNLLFAGIHKLEYQVKIEPQNTVVYLFWKLKALQPVDLYTNFESFTVIFL